MNVFEQKQKKAIEKPMYLQQATTVIQRGGHEILPPTSGNTLSVDQGQGLPTRQGRGRPTPR